MHTHTLTVLQRLACAMIMAILPFAAFAQELSDVPGVSGIRAEEQNGNVTVSWDPVEGSIETYRIFYSHASILDQGGTYDDYEDAPGTALTYTLTSVPPVPTLYVSVLAVNEKGIESPFFMEEATVNLGVPSGALSSSAAIALPPSPTVAMVSSTLQLLTAVSTSSTGVLLTFTHPVSIPEQLKDDAFTINSGSGQKLPIVRYRMNGNRVLIDTALQTVGRVYQITIHGSLAGQTPSGEIVPQESATAPLLFTGLQTDTSVPDLKNITMKQKGKDVEITWTLPSATIRELQIQQSTNGGRTFGTAVRLNKTSNGVTIPNVPNGAFTIFVRVVSLDGSLSRGVQQTLTIGGSLSSPSSSSKASSSSQRSVASKPTTPPVKPGTLPNSGPVLAVIVGLSGGAAGIRFVRRKNATKV